MDKNSAALILNIALPATEEEIVEHAEAKVFEIRDFFLMQAVHPVLFAGRRKRLASILNAKNALLDTAEQPAVIKDAPILEIGSFLQLLESYSSHLMKLRLQVSSSLLPEKIIPAVDAMIELQIQFEKHFLELGVNLQEVEAPKQTEAINLGAVLFKLKRKEDVALDLAKEKARILKRING